MFRVKDKKTNEIIDVYAVLSDYSKTKFFYYDKSLEEWKWIQADWTEPYTEDYFIIKDKSYYNDMKIRSVINDKDAWDFKHKNRVHEYEHNNVEYVIEMLKDILLRMNMGECNWKR